MGYITRRRIRIKSRTEARELGWVRGCYDSVFDDGASYRGSPFLLGSFDGLSHDEVVHLYREGYRQGKASRLV